jgi:hypothetical protein
VETGIIAPSSPLIVCYATLTTRMCPMKNRLHAATTDKTEMVLFYHIAFLKEISDKAIRYSIVVNPLNPKLI